MGGIQRVTRFRESYSQGAGGVLPKTGYTARPMGKTNFFDFKESTTRRSGGGGAGGGASRAGNGAAAPATTDGKTAPPTGPRGTEALSVSQLTHLIDEVLKAVLPPVVLVKGEVSNFKPHAASGHIYFTLKDSEACIDCVMWRSDAARLKFDVSDGLEVLADGRVAVYPQRGKYQLYVETLQPLGQGALELAFKQLRAKLEREGLFLPERKKPLPEFPSRVVIVTGAQTAALQDVLKVLRRFPWVKLFVYPVPVQGDGAGERIAGALAHLNRTAGAIGGADLILLARGGGSLEDLWAFNEETVARAIASSKIPVVTGIGHEVDTSIADLVADYFAHTPTEAAQVISRNWRTAPEVVESSALRLGRELRNVMAHARGRLAAVERHEAFRRPLDRVRSLQQHLDHQQTTLRHLVAAAVRVAQWRVGELHARLEQVGPAFVVSRFRSRLADAQRRLARGASARLFRSHEHVARLNTDFVRLDPRHRIRVLDERLRTLQCRLNCAAGVLQRRRGERVESLARFLHAVGPEQVLRRGYSITTRKKGGAILRSAGDVRPGERLVTRFSDGQVESVAEDPTQPKLFD
jgi:exodeoxyribonuclease VII large subunit